MLIADDQTLFSQSMKIVLEGSEDCPIAVVGVARDGQEAVDIALREKPDVILMDVRMPGMNGVQATQILHRELPGAKILMLTTFQDDDLVESALAGGAVGYILKEVQPEELVESIRAARNGFFLYSHAIGTRIAQKVALASASTDERAIRVAEIARAFPELGPRETEVLYYISLSYDNHEISEKLFLAEQTVKNYITSIYAKLGVHDRLHCVRLLAQRTGAEEA